MTDLNPVDPTLSSVDAKPVSVPSEIFAADTTLNPDERAELLELRKQRDTANTNITEASYLTSGNETRQAVSTDPTRSTFVGDRAMDRGDGGFVGQPNNDVAVSSGKRWAARDFTTRDYYGGIVDPSLLDAFDKLDNTDAGWILGVQRNVIVDRFGNTETVWVEAPRQEMPGAIPGEYRRLYFEEIDA